MTPAQADGVRTAAITVLVFLTLAPLTLTLPNDGLDPSWGLVIERAALQGWQWGRDIVFTFGPYGYHFQRIFHPDLAAEVLAGSAIRAALIGLGVAFTLRGAGIWQSCAALAAVALALPVARDSAYFLLPFLVAVLHFTRPAKAPLWYLLLVAAYCGFAALIKTTFAILGLVVLLIVDLDRLLDRRVPVFTPVCLAATLAAYIVAGQSFASLPDFIALSLDVASGFSDAMSVFDWLRAVELSAFIGASTVVLALVLAEENRRGRLGTRTGRLTVLALAVFWFVTYKAGFTRHDLHTLVSWTCLGVGAALYAAARRDAPPSPVRHMLLAAAVCIALLAPVRLALAPGFGLGGVLLQTLFQNPRETLSEAAALITKPEAWQAEMQRRRALSLAAIRDRNPLPASEGTIDTVPSLQAAVVAADLDGGAAYHPRPMFQEYSTYTAGLIAANFAFMESDDAPDTVLLAPGSIDNRYPSLSEGPLWPILLRRYADAGLAGPLGHLDGEVDVLVLRRRDSDAVVTLGQEETVTARFGVPLALPDAGAPLVAKIDLPLSATGWMLSVLHQTPTVRITVALVDGTRHTHRLIPDIARAGFVLSPYMPDAATARQLFSSRGGGGGEHRVTEIQVDVPDLIHWAFADRISVSIRTVR